MIVYTFYRKINYFLQNLNDYITMYTIIQRYASVVKRKETCYKYFVTY